jgi:ADP-heptose:LPS heptosyltransferase
MKQTFNTIGVISGGDQIGDALLKLPFLRALRNAFPEAKIHWITSLVPTAFGNVLRDSTRNLIDEIHDRPQWLATTTRPALEASPKFDLLIDTRSRWREVLLARKIPHEIFVAKAAGYLFSDRRPGIFKRRSTHITDKLLLLVELAAGYAPPHEGVLPVRRDLLDKAQQLLPEGKTYVGIAPGCSMAERRWPRERFLQLAHMQAARGHVPVFILGPLEQDAYEELKTAVPSALFPLQDHAVWGTQDMTLDHTLALGTRLDIAVANDSGPGHILAAVDCRILSLFGPTTPLKAAPRTSRGRSLRAQNFGGETMQDIPVDAVNKAVNEMLGASQ